MAWTVSSFRARWTEFASAPSDAVVTSALAEAAAECDERIFGASYDHAVGLLAAHKISVGPGGQQARLDSDEAETTYSREWTKLARKRAGGPFTIGQDLS